MSVCLSVSVCVCLSVCLCVCLCLCVCVCLFEAANEFLYYSCSVYSYSTQYGIIFRRQIADSPQCLNMSVTFMLIKTKTIILITMKLEQNRKEIVSKARTSYFNEHKRLAAQKMFFQ